MNEVCPALAVTGENSGRTNFLARMAGKYIWWRTANESLSLPRHILAQVMDIGVWDDILEMRSLFSNEELAGVLANAECGEFRPRSWHYWHYILTGCAVDHVPPMPGRFRKSV
jgi:hypothetical protein